MVQPPSNAKLRFRKLLRRKLMNPEFIILLILPHLHRSIVAPRGMGPRHDFGMPRSQACSSASCVAEYSDPPASHRHVCGNGWS